MLEININGRRYTIEQFASRVLGMTDSEIAGYTHAGLEYYCTASAQRIARELGVALCIPTEPSHLHVQSMFGVFVLHE